MSTRLAERLAAARRRRFVGRQAEKQFYQTMIEATEPPYSILYIYGPGGVGKSSLLREFVSLTPSSAGEVIQLDGRNIEATPEAFVANLSMLLGGQASIRNEPQTGYERLVGNFAERLEAHSQRLILLIDTSEMLAPLDTWLRESFIPQLPANALIVMAGRNPPSAGWRTDSGWQSLLKIVPLRNLTPEESRSYLNLRIVPDVEHESILAFTYGHPLAISLVADLLEQQSDPQHPQRKSASITLSAHSPVTNDVVRSLLEQMMRDAPTRNHRLALESCAMVRYMTEGLLTEMLAIEDAYPYFEWLRGLSFIDSGRLGLFPHDLVREAVSVDLRWRNPDLYVELHRRARNYYHHRIHETEGQIQRRILIDLVFLHRDNAVVRPFYEWQDNESLWTDRAKVEEQTAIIEMVQRHEGSESAKIVQFWLTRPSANLLVIRDTQQQITGFVMLLAIHQVTNEEIAYDPAVKAATEFLANNAPLRAQESVTYFRFWMDKEHYQGVSPTQSRIFLACVQHYLTTAGLAYSLFPCASPDFFAGVFAYADINRIPAADFRIGDQQYGLFGHDWRLTPPAAWLDLLAEREVAVSSATQTRPVAPPPAEPTLIVLSEPEFATAVREALKHYTLLPELQRSPLLRSRLVSERSGKEANSTTRISILQALLKESADTLQSSPKQHKLFRALHHTYFQPAATQELAAEIIDVPFSSYRRHLKEGIDTVVEILWNREIGGG